MTEPFPLVDDLATGSTPDPRGRRLLWWSVGIGAVLAAVVVALFWWPGWAVRYVLDPDAVAERVADLVEVDPSMVSCPSGESATTAHTFTCTLAGIGQQVTITVLGDENGSYLIG